MTSKKTVALALILLLAAIHARAQWVQTYGPFVGTFNTMVNSTESGTIVAGTPMGCFKSSNNGASWTEGLSYATYMLHGGVYLPIYAATSGGLYRSSDDGTIWTKVNFPETGSVRAVTTFPSLLFASSSSQGYRSTNAGVSWDSLSFGSFNSLVIMASSRVAATTRSGIYRSTNNGVNWTKVFSLSSGETVQRLMIATNGDLLAIAHLNATPSRDLLLRSTDYGATWNDESMVPAVSPTALDAGVFHTFATTEFGYGPVFTNGGVYRSTNGGKSWSNVYSMNGNMTSLAVLSKGVVFAGDWAGVVRSLDTGRTWGRIEFGIGPRHSVYSFAVTLGGTYYAGTGNGLFRSSNNGSRWLSLNPDPVARKVSSIGVSSTGTVYSGVGYYGVYTANGMFRSTNDGATWAATGPGDALEINSNTALAGGEMIAGTEENNAQKGGIYHTSSGGTSWAPPVSRMDSIVNTVATNGAGEIFAGMKGGAISRSTNGGVTWTSRNPGVSADILSLVYHPKGVWFAGTSAGVLRTTNSGTTWAQINSGLTNLTIRALAVNRAGTLYAGTAEGVFQSTNSGSLWTDFSTDLADRNVLCLSMDSSGYLLAGVRGGGVYRTVQTTVGVDVALSTIPEEFILEQNYPNPFNPSTTIRYGLPLRAHVALTIFNTLGQQVAILQNGEQEAGYHEMKFDGRNLSSGVYFYRMTAGTFVESRRFLLIR